MHKIALENVKIIFFDKKKDMKEIIVEKGKSMKVLHILNTGKYSGAENVVITLIHALEGKVECAYVSPDGPIRDILKEEKIKYFSISTPRTNARELKKIIHQYKPDIIHTHDYNAGIQACLTGTKLPIISHLHNNTPWLRTVCPKSLAYFISCANYKKILTVSNSVMDEFVFGNLVKKKSKVVGNPINLLEIRKKAEQTEILQETSDVIFLGRLSEEKRPLFFLEIIADIVKRMPNLRAVMVGAGKLYDEVEIRIKEFGLEDNVKLYGFQKNPYGLLKASKVMCMPSEWEGFGLAAVESLAFGKPVIASPVGGLKTIVNNQCGRLCEEKEEYIEELEKLLSDELYYNTKVSEAKKRVVEYDNIRNYSEQVMEIYYANYRI